MQDYMVSEIRYLGHIFNSDSVIPDPAKTEIFEIMGIIYIWVRP